MATVDLARVREQARARTGSRAGYTAPSNVYQTADGAWITLVGSSDPIFRRLCRAMGHEEMASDARFDTNVHRTENLVELDAKVAAWCRSLRFAELAARLAAEEVPFTKVYSIADVQEDPHFRARGTFIELQDEALGAIPAPAAVPRFTGRETTVPHAGPRTGEHNEEVYAGLGLTATDLARLRERKVV